MFIRLRISPEGIDISVSPSTIIRFTTLEDLTSINDDFDKNQLCQSDDDSKSTDSGIASGKPLQTLQTSLPSRRFYLDNVYSNIAYYPSDHQECENVSLKSEDDEFCELLDYYSRLFLFFTFPLSFFCCALIFLSLFFS